MAFFFCNHGQNKENDVAGGVQSVQVLLLKEDLNGWIPFLQLSDPADTVQQVSGKSADGFCNDHIDLSCHSVAHHELEGRSVVRVCTGETVIHIGADILPFRICLDHVPVVILLHFNGNQLINVIRGNTTVSSHPENPIFFGSCCRCGDLPDVCSGIGIDFFPERLFGSGTLGHETVISRRCFLLQLLRLPSGLLLRLRAYVFQGMVHSRHRRFRW